jgi:hypothetical protein
MYSHLVKQHHQTNALLSSSFWTCGALNKWYLLVSWDSSVKILIQAIEIINRYSNIKLRSGKNRQYFIYLTHPAGLPIRYLKSAAVWCVSADSVRAAIKEWKMIRSKARPGKLNARPVRKLLQKRVSETLFTTLGCRRGAAPVLGNMARCLWICSPG